MSDGYLDDGRYAVRQQDGVAALEQLARGQGNVPVRVPVTDRLALLERQHAELIEELGRLRRFAAQVATELGM